MKKSLFILIFLFFSQSIMAEDYLIFSLNHELWMGDEAKKDLKKNYYINLGENQGVKKNTVLDVFRITSVKNSFGTDKRNTFKVKIGQLKVIHPEDDTSIAIVKNFLKSNDIPLFEIDAFMIGDHVEISVD